MGLKNVGAWIRQALGGQGANSNKAGAGADSRIGKQVLTNEGTVIGTITAVWRGTDANDQARHEDTLGVQRPEQGEAGLLYIPSSAIANETAQNVTLMVDMSQVASRGWRFRPTWLSQDDPAPTQAEHSGWKASE